MLLGRYLVEQRVNGFDELTPDVLDHFMASRARAPRNFNDLLGTVRQLFNWLVLHEHIGRSPLRTEPKRSGPPLRPFLFDKAQARRLSAVAVDICFTVDMHGYRVEVAKLPVECRRRFQYRNCETLISFRDMKSDIYVNLDKSAPISDSYLYFNQQ